jgi:hypothetical protein
MPLLQNSGFVEFSASRKGMPYKLGPELGFQQAVKPCPCYKTAGLLSFQQAVKACLTNSSPNWVFSKL